MRLLAPLLSLLAISSIAAVSAVAANAGNDMLAKFSALTSTKAKSGVLHLTDELYADLVGAPRNYTAVVLLTALDPKFGCHLCREFQPEYELLATSWQRSHKNGDGLFFTSLDFSNGRDTFVKLKLNTAPIMFLFPPTVGPNANLQHIVEPMKFDFTQNAIPAERVAQWISLNTHMDPKVVRPFDYTNLVLGGGAAIVGLAILKLSFNTLKPALYSRTLWATISLVLILLFTSGHMFNHIRRVPYIANNGKGGISYIAGGFSNQFGLETQIVAGVYSVLAFCAIALALKMPRVTDPTKQKIGILVWNAVLLCAFSFLLGLFRQKNGGYPFYLPPVI